MSRRRIRVLLLAAVLLASGARADPQPAVAATVDGDAIGLREVDALAPALTRDVHARLLGVARATAQRLASAGHVQILLPSGAELETPLPAERIVARTDRAVVRAAALEEAAALRLYRLRGELYLARRRNLETLIERRLLGAEARRRGVTPAVLEASLASLPGRPDRSAAAATVEEERARPYHEFRARFARREALVQQLRRRADIRIALLAPERPRLNVEPAGGVPLSGAGGPVLVAFTNYRCPLCRATHRELDRLLAGDARPQVVLRDFVPAHDEAAADAAALVRCAARRQRHLAVRQALLAREPFAGGDARLTVERLAGFAALAATTPADLERCMRSAETRARIEQDTQAALRLGFDGPPAFVAAGTPLSGMQSAKELRAALTPTRGRP